MNAVRLTFEQLNAAQAIAVNLNLVIDRIMGDQDHNYVNVEARKAGYRGNHEPRWTEAQRLEFIRRIND